MPRTTRSKARRSTIVFVVIAGLLVVGGLGGLLITRRKIDEPTAIAAAKAAVLPGLERGTALVDVQAVRQGDGSYLVDMYFDADTGHGGKVRRKRRAVVEKDGKVFDVLAD